MSEPRYGSPRALRRAVTDRLRDLAARRPGARLADLLRQFTYDRLLARIFTADPSRWVLKGAAAMLARMPTAAMLARMPTAARHSNDIDLCREEGDLSQAESALRVAAKTELLDYFRFELGPGRPLAQGGRALRVPVTAYLGATRFAEFHVDLVASLTMTGRVEKVSPLIDIDLGLRFAPECDRNRPRSVKSSSRQTADMANPRPHPANPGLTVDEASYGVVAATISATTSRRAWLAS